MVTHHWVRIESHKPSTVSERGTTKTDCQQFFMTLPILSAMFEMALVILGPNLFLGWMCWACFKKELSKGDWLCKELAELTKHLRQFLWFFFVFQKATSLFLQRVILLLFQHQFCLTLYVFSCFLLKQYAIWELLIPESSTSDV